MLVGWRAVAEVPSIGSPRSTARPFSASGTTTSPMCSNPPPTVWPWRVAVVDALGDHRELEETERVIPRQATEIDVAARGVARDELAPGREAAVRRDRADSASRAASRRRRPSRRGADRGRRAGRRAWPSPSRARPRSGRRHRRSRCRGGSRRARSPASRSPECRRPAVPAIRRRRPDPGCATRRAACPTVRPGVAGIRPAGRSRSSPTAAGSTSCSSARTSMTLCAMAVRPRGGQRRRSARCPGRPCRPRTPSRRTAPR